jgi:hypothetical protein
MTPIPLAQSLFRHSSADPDRLPIAARAQAAPILVLSFISFWGVYRAQILSHTDTPANYDPTKWASDLR